MTGSRAARSNGSSGTTPRPRRRAGRARAGAAKAGDWLDTTRQAWEQTANRALEQAGRAERIDGRSLPDRRDAAHREGDLERAAELSREPNVHRGTCQESCVCGGDHAASSKRVWNMALSWWSTLWILRAGDFHRPSCSEDTVRPSFSFRVASEWK